MLFTVPSTGGYQRKPYSSLKFSGIKMSSQKFHETRKLESFYEHLFVERKNEGRKPDKNSNLRRLEFMRSRIPSEGVPSRLRIAFIVYMSGSGT